MGLSRFSALPKPIKSVKGNSSLSSGSLFLLFAFFCFPSHLFSPLLSFPLLFVPSISFPLLLDASCLSPLPFALSSTPPSLSSFLSPPLYFSVLISSYFPVLISSFSTSPLHLPSFLFLHSSSRLCFRLVLSSLYYVVAVGEIVCDSNLSCPIISCCSIAEP